MYIYEFYDDMDESLRKRFSILGNEAYWYPFINDPKEVQRFEIEFQNLLVKRQKLKNKIQKAVSKSQIKDKEKPKKKKGNTVMEGEEEKAVVNNELMRKIKEFIGSSEDLSQEICDGVNDKLELAKDISYDYKTSILGNSSTRTCCITKECIQSILLMPDDKIEGKVKLGYTCPKDRLNKKRDFRRLANFHLSKYYKDPVGGMRLVARPSNIKSSKIKDSQNKKSKIKKNKNIDVLSLGSQKTFDPESEFNPKLTYTFKLSDKEKIDECIEELKSNKDYQIKTDTYFAEFLSEDLCIKKLNKLFEMEVEDDKTAITVSNPWIQIVLGILIMTKDFINYNENFSLESKKKKDKIPKLFDLYWNFQNKEIIFFVDSGKSEFKKLLFETKHESEVKRVQSFCMNLCFRGLAYYYSKNGVDYTIDRVMIHFEGKKTDKAREIAEIEDMSHLMVVLAQFEIEEYNKKALKKKNEGTLLILGRITFADPSFYFIPAILPMYIVNIKEGESDESEGSDGSDKSNGEDKSENEEKDESEDSDYKNKSKKSGKTNKSIKSKSKKKKNDSDFSDSNEEQIITTKNKKSKK